MSEIPLQMIVTVVVLMVTVIMFIHGKSCSDITALLALPVLLAFGVLTPSEAFSSFSNSAIFIIASMFVVSGAIVRSGLC